jgi:lipopolysaccharide export system protein LptA
MDDFNRRALSAVAVAILASPGTHAAATRPQQSIVLDAQSLDGSFDNVVFRKVRITQGGMSIAADQGQGTSKSKNVDFDNSLWVFRGNVKINVDQGQLTSDEAQITFYKQQLTKAVANGNPAAFEERVMKSGKLAHGTADSIDYDAGKGIVSLLNNAYLSDGQIEVRGGTLKYNLLSQTIVAEPTDQGSQRVHIVVPPPPPKP